MRWISAILLRLSLGIVIGIAGLIGMWFLVIADKVFFAMPMSITLFGPIVVGMGLSELIIDGVNSHRWRRLWNRLTDDSDWLSLTSQNNASKALRIISGPSTWPTIANKRTLRFTKVLATKLLQQQVREPWSWEIHSLAWSHIRTNSRLLDETRVALNSCEQFNDAAWRVGLALLNERSDESGLAIRMAGESMARDLSAHPAEHAAALEQAWISAYVRMPDMRDTLLPPLTRRFLTTKRRDEVSGRVFIDAFVHKSASSELIAEMSRTADALEATGGEPELIANLRALAEADASIEEQDSSDTATFSPFAPFPDDEPTFAEPIPEIEQELENVETEPSEPVQFAFDTSETRDTSDLGDPLQTSADISKHRFRYLIWLIPAVLLVGVVLVTLIRTYEMPPESAVDTLTQQQLAAMQSELPYTLQVSALPTRARAISLIRTLREKNLDAYLVTTTQNELTWYRVHIGHYSNMEEAKFLAEQLKADSVIDDYYVARFEPGEIPAELLQTNP